MLELKMVEFETIKDSLYEYFGSKMLVYYGSRLGYCNLLSEVINQIPRIVNTKIDEISLLQAAVIGSDDDQPDAPRKGNTNAVDILIRKGADVGATGYSETNILEYVCKNGYYDMIEVLIHHGVKCSEGNTPLHIVASYNVINEEVMKILQELGIDLNSQNYKGETALYRACSQGKTENAKRLLEVCADVNIVDSKNRNGLHEAAMILQLEPQNTELLTLLIQHNVSVNVRDISGKTALHLACKSSFEVAKLLIENGADISIVDDYGLNVLHYAAQTQKDNTKLLRFLTDRGFNANLPTLDGVTPLHVACEQRQYENIKTLIDVGGSVNAVDLYNRNSLHYAINSIAPNSKLKIEVIRLLLENGVNKNAQDEDGTTPLQYACQHEQLDCLKTLLDHGVGIDNTDNEGRNTLHYAAHSLNESIEIIDLLVSYGFDLNARSKGGTTALQFACQNGPSQNIKRFVDLHADVYVLDYEDNNVLHYLTQSRNENDDSLDLFIQNYKFDINARNSNGTTALLFACQTYRENQADRVQKLIDQGASVNIADNDNMNALHYAALSPVNNTEIVNLLLEKGLDVNSRTKDNRTPLHFACKESQVETVRILIQHGADVNAVDSENLSALHYAAQSNEINTTTINLLISSGVAVNGADIRGRTSLHFACGNLCLQNVQQLMEQGAVVNVIDNDEMNALHYAVQSEVENTEIINLLIQRNLNINSRNKYGETPLHLCCKNGNYSDIEKLIKFGADCTEVTTELRSILHYATFSRNSDVIFADALLKLELDINCRDINGISVLHLACLNGDYDTVKLLVDKSAYVHIVDNEKKNVLHYAVLASNPNKQLIKFLIDSQIDVNAESLSGLSVLSYAIENDCFEAVRIMIEEDLFRETVNPSVETYLYYSVYSGCSYGVKLFMESIENIGRIDVNSEEFPLHFASKSEQLEADLLIKFTEFIRSLIEYFREASHFSNAVVKYSHKGLVTYLKLLYAQNNDLSLIFGEVEDLYVFNKRCKHFQAYLKRFHEGRRE